MPSTAQLRARLLNKLKELFQLDQPDLDFGFYRIMHAKAEQVERFIDKDLLKIVEEAFANSAAEKVESVLDLAKRKLVDAMGEDALQADGSVNPAFANTPAGKAYAEAATKAASQVTSLSDEGQVYDHLFRFFERYYDNGDFVSRRYYTRETDSRAAPFAIPYNGEEVKLHWANADQYYIKTAEYFNNYTFDLTQAAEIRAMSPEERSLLGISDKPVMAHFKIVEASEGEHGNVKAKDDDKRFFIIHKNGPIAFDENGELVVNFEYRSDPEKGSKQEGSWRDIRNAEAAEAILKALDTAKAENPTAATCLLLFKTAAPTEKDKKRPLLAKYLNQYTARNTMDYFIHKNLGGFLRRELDFYIKNEVMRLDDLDQADSPAVESYLAKLKVLRKIAHKLIDFLAQLEDFQKKLWLKKKFVVETNYCITLDRVPEALYPEIAANDAQREEWVKLFAINEIKGTEGDLLTPGNPSFSAPLSVEFLKANDKLVLDTKFFDEGFKARLLEAIEDFDEQCNGLLVHSENFQALNCLHQTYLKQIKAIYIDPPYNAKSSEILYKNTYKHASWMTLMADRLNAAVPLQSADSVLTVAIDENEQERLGQLLSNLYPTEKKTCVTVVHNPGGIQGDNFSYTHEFAYFVFPNNGTFIGKVKRPEGDITPLRDWGGDGSKRETAANCFYPIYAKGTEVVGFGSVCPDDFHPESAVSENDDGTTTIYPIDGEGVERKWRFARQSVESIQEELQCDNVKGEKQIRRNISLYRYKTVWHEKKHNSNTYGSNYLGNILGTLEFSFPKSIYIVYDSLHAVTQKSRNCTIIDFFAGSGTTVEALRKLNATDGGTRKFIAVEMGNYFSTATKPRVLKTGYSTDWKDGKPTTRDTGISQSFKYIRLESYEDTLNNLTLDEDAKRTETIARSPALKEDFMLRYLLDVETRGSQSLLNIDAFADPTAYQLSVKKPGSDTHETRPIDLIETFNYLIGLRVTHYAAPQNFTASFKREPDPELPEDQHTKLVVDGAIKQEASGPWWFRKVEGWVPRNPSIADHETRTQSPQNMERILIVWRKLTGDLEQDNLMLDVWFRKHAISTQDYEYDTIYVNGSNNLPNLKQDDEHWKVRLIEEEFMKRMWDTSES